MKTLTDEMCIGRKARCIGRTSEAWWYVNHRTIDISARHENGTITDVILTRKQLLRALEIMDEKP